MCEGEVRIKQCKETDFIEFLYILLFFYFLGKIPYFKVPEIKRPRSKLHSGLSC